jgi:dTDP-4-dehydrorhamnose reductase
MKILLIGKDGQVGWELQRSLCCLGEVVAVDYPDIDLADPASIERCVAAVEPDAVVNAAAYTAVDHAETEVEASRAINTEAVGLLAREMARRGGWLVHYSTDYVFDGSGSVPWSESDEPHPVNAYGLAKRDGELAIAASGCRHLLFRTSWVYAARGRNFVRTILRLAAERDSLRVIADQFGAPTSAELLADVTAVALRAVVAQGASDVQLGGVYHLTARGETTWHGIACRAVAIAIEAGAVLRVAPEFVVPIKTSEYPLPARRPANSRLCVDLVERRFGILCPDWRIHFDRTVTEIVRGADA